MANDSPADDHLERLHELVPKAEMIVRQLEEERARWKSWGEAFASGMRGEQRTGAESDAPIRIELTQSESENRFWRVLSRLGKVLSPLAVLVSALGFLFTLWQYGKRVEELNATTIYQVAREGRILAGDLDTSRATTGQAINFHFSVYYLQEKGVVESELRPLLLLDLCSLTKERTDFSAVWSDINVYYPTNFRNAVDALVSLNECTRAALNKIAGSVSVWEGDE